MASINFLAHLKKKLKTGNMRSIHLNALPGRYATRLDLSKLDVIDNKLSNSFLTKLLQEPNFKFTISFSKTNINNISDIGIKSDLNIIAKKLNNLYYENNDNFLEHGIKTFGFGYPILIKRNKQDPSKIIKAPIIIWHLDIEKSTKKTNKWVISKDEDSPITLNEVLISHIEQDEEITIQEISHEFLEDSVIDNDEIIQICNEVLKQLNVANNNLNVQISSCPNREQIEKNTGNMPWISWAGIFGLYKAQKESIITEIDKLIDNINSFKFEKLIFENYQTSTITGVETDPSQEEIINSLTKKPVRIIQGPPGTGKSQTLTAIITNALENGAKCLVVCEKKTALDVIYKNLENIGFGKFCAIIDDVSRDRKKIIDKVRAGIDEIKYYNESFRENEYYATFNSYIQLRKEINKKYKSVLIKIFGDDNWKDVIGRCISNKRIESHNILKKYLDTNEFDFTYEEYQGILKAIKEGKFLFSEINTLQHPLEKLNDKLFSGPYFNSTKTKIKETLKSMNATCRSLIDDYHSNIRIFGNRFSNSNLFNKILISSIAIFSKKFKQLKIEKEKFLNQYHSLILQHENSKYFNFDFEQKKGIPNLFTCNQHLKLYQKTIKELLYQFNTFQAFYKWKSFFLSLSRKEKSILNASIMSEANNWEFVFESWYFDCILSKYEREIGPFHQNNRQIIELSKLNVLLKQMQQNKITDLWANQQQNSINKFKIQKGNINSLYNYKKNKQYDRKNSLRKIIYTDFDLFTDFFPVVMVNPVVSSSVLPLKEGLFDIVIFDEASQLRLEDTYTAYIRGKFKIITGDVHQMPPSNYFGKEIALDIDDNDEDLDEIYELPDDSLEMADKESLLQYGIDSGFDKSYLDFHYRSRHPYLIEFSNAAFYGSRLTAMPERYEYKPIRFLQINGLYKKNRTNPKEAKAVINILFDNLYPNKNGEYPSVGIATFNIDQRNLILEMIHNKCYMDKEKNIKHEKLKKSGLFIKNLENIQGDERDIIIISTTFGINAEGKFRQSFGPINQMKGYKLLNVIITRAKHRLYLCTSIPSKYFSRYKEEIMITGNLGKAVFYSYLAYAKAIENGDHEARENILKLLEEHCAEGKPYLKSNFAESPFEQAVYEYLINFVEKKRIKTRYKFGGFKIDFVILSKTNEKPIIAIECDGAQYDNTEEAYAYDIYRQKIIENRIGLHYYKIWSTNWWMAPQEEVQKLVKFINLIDTKNNSLSKEEKFLINDEHVTITDEPITNLLENVQLIENKELHS